jgi:hypothetical protein
MLCRHGKTDATLGASARNVDVMIVYFIVLMAVAASEHRASFREAQVIHTKI